MDTLKQVDGELINNWYILALENEVPQDRPLKRWMYDQPYVIFRDKQGQPAVLQDRCLHRGAPLSLGTVESGEVRCPYHGWKFDSSGRVREIPSDGADPARLTETKKWCLPRVPTVLQDGCVWIWAGAPEKATLGPAWRFPAHSNPRVQSYFMITDFDNEVTHLIQNFMDVPHTVFVHSKWFRNRSLLKVPVQIEVGNSRVMVRYHQPQDSIGFTEKILNPKREPMIHTDEFIFPNLTRVDYKFGDKFFIINSQCTPISRYKSRVYTWIAYDVGWPSALLKPFMRFYTRKVITQDVDIMKNQGDNLKQFGEGDFVSTQADELHLAIDRMRNIGKKEPQNTQTLQYVREREFWI